MSSERIGVAIHGCGDVARAHLASWLKQPAVDVVSISSRRRESAKRLADQFGVDCPIRDNYDEVLADPAVDVVNLSGPNDVHTPQGVAAARAGKHVLVEKPVAMSMDDNRRLRDAVAEAGVKSICSFVLRWNPLFDIIRRLLAERAIGDVFYAEVDYWHGLKGWSGLDWGASIAGGGSTMLTAGCHALDALRWFVQDDVVEVSAMSNNHAGRFEYDANVVAILRFAGGAIGKSSTLFDFEAPYALNIDLAGSEGTIRDNRLWSRHLLPGQTDWATVPTILPDSGAVEHHPFDAQMAHFVECIQTGRDSHCNIADAYKTHELCLAIDRSLELGGQPVRLPLA